MSDAARLDELLIIMARLRDPECGCPWDAKQDFDSVAPYTIEEAYEVADAIQRRDYADLRDELGDLLFQVIFHARMAEEAGHFNFEEVVAGLADKLTRRHPHVFGDTHYASAEEQTRAWEELKAQERAKRGDGDDQSALAGIARGLPEWRRALKLQQRGLRSVSTGPVRNPCSRNSPKKLTRCARSSRPAPIATGWRTRSATCCS